MVAFIPRLKRVGFPAPFRNERPKTEKLKELGAPLEPSICHKHLESLASVTSGQRLKLIIKEFGLTMLTMSTLVQYAYKNKIHILHGNSAIEDQCQILYDEMKIGTYCDDSFPPMGLAIDDGVPMHLYELRLDDIGVTQVYTRKLYKIQYMSSYNGYYTCLLWDAQVEPLIMIDFLNREFGFDLKMGQPPDLIKNPKKLKLKFLMSSTKSK